MTFDMTVLSPHGSQYHGSQYHGSHAGPHGPAARGTTNNELPTVDELLWNLMQLNGMVALGFLHAPQAGVIQGNLKILLEYRSAERREQERRQDGTPDTQGLAEHCREHPEILPLVEPFLTEEQIRWILEGTVDRNDGGDGDGHGNGRGDDHGEDHGDRPAHCDGGGQGDGHGGL